MAASASPVILEPKNVKSATFALFPHLFAMSDGTRCHDLSFLNVKSMVFPVIMCVCESWTRKNAEYRRIDVLELWCRSSLSILKEINPEYSLEGLLLKLKLQYFGHLMQRTDSLEKTVMLGKTEGRRRRRQQHHRFNGHESEQTPGDSEGRKTWHAAVHRVPKRLSN